MNNTETKKEKKPWSKKKKILVIVLSIIAFLFLATICAGLGVLKWYCTPEKYEITSCASYVRPETKMIAHRGFRAMAPENTAPAFEEAGKANFWGNECDVYRTADGVWVVQHDKNTYRMMDCTKNIEKTTYEKLKEHRTDNGVNIDKYDDLKICTLKEYLEICDKYSMTAIIELKGGNNTEYYNELVDYTNQYSNVDIIFISFDYDALMALRKICNNKMMYLVQEISEEDIDLVLDLGDCGIDFNGNKEKNFDHNGMILNKCRKEGIEMGAWTIDDPVVMQKLLNYNVTYITTNCITY